MSYLSSIISKVEQESPEILCIYGPTASGKTHLSIELAKALGGEVINMDSRQIYTGMDIGTGKATKEEMGDIPHHLFDICDPDEVFTVADYRKHADAAIQAIKERGNLPILAGGTGLYLESILFDLSFGPKSDQGIRSKLERWAEEVGTEAVYQRLEEVDPAEAKALGRHNLRYLLRALEIYEVTGRPKSEQKGKKKSQYQAKVLAIEWDRSTLKTRINKRHQHMFDAKPSIVKETHELRSKGYTKDLESMSSIGYRECLQYIERKISLEKAIELTKRGARKYAKRQETWLRRLRTQYQVMMIEGETLAREAQSADPPKSPEQS